jgi:hypothetical protein
MKELSFGAERSGVEFWSLVRRIKEQSFWSKARRMSQRRFEASRVLEFGAGG